MAVAITLPRLGWSMDEGTFVRWLRNPGELIRAGEVLFELEGEKAVQEIEAIDSGILHLTDESPQPGSLLPVGAVLAYLLAEGESAPTDLASDSDAEANESGHSVGIAASPEQPRAAAIVSGGADGPPSSPRARRMARELGIDWKSITGSGRGGRIRERDVLAAANAKSTGSGAGGNTSIARSTAIFDAPTETILLPQISSPSSPAAKSTSTSGAVSGGATAGALRSIIAKRMMTSCEQTAPVTLTTRCDATNLVSLREQFKTQGATGNNKEGDGSVPSYTDIITKVISIALRAHPVLNGQGRSPGAVSVGIAVDTTEGLLVPVLHGVENMTLREIMVRSRDLIERARKRRATLEELQGGTFTITNLGSFGIDGFTPIINYPETAILGIGAIRREAVVIDDDRIVPRSQLTLSLTFNHCIVDGAPAARFLQDVVRGLEAPAAWLIS